MFYLFPSLIHVIEVKSFQKIREDLIKFIYQERKIDNKGVVKSNVGGWHSKDYFDSENIVVRTVRDETSNYFNINKVFNDNVALNYYNTCYNINKRGDSNGKHSHGGCHLSGVFWIKIPKDSGNFIFSSPYGFSQYDEISNYSKEVKEMYAQHLAYSIRPKEGDMLIFPSCIEHKVDINESREDRISASFNINFTTNF